MKKRAVIGILLILLGVFFLLKPHVEWTGSVFLMGLGALFVLGYLFFGSYGLLVPGGILLGLGGGILMREQLHEPAGRVIFFVLFGAGFILIYIVDRFKRATPVWPLIPGGILIGIGAYMQVERLGWLPADLGHYLKILWPAVLILLGIYLILRKK